MFLFITFVSVECTGRIDVRSISARAIRATRTSSRVRGGELSERHLPLPLRRTLKQTDRQTVETHNTLPSKVCRTLRQRVITIPYREMTASNGLY